MNQEIREIEKRLMNLRLDKYVVDQGLMLNCLVGSLIGNIIWQNGDGKIDASVIVKAIDCAYDRSRLAVVNK
jgi:hypothetical protein